MGIQTRISRAGYVPETAFPKRILSAGYVPRQEQAKGIQFSRAGYVPGQAFEHRNLSAGYVPRQALRQRAAGSSWWWRAMAAGVCWLGAAAAALLLAACGGGAVGGPAVTAGGTAQQNAAISQTVEGRAVRKVRTTGAAWAALEETLQPIRDGHNAPRRSLLLANGTRYQPAPDWCLIDFDVHPSGELSLVLVGGKNVALVRLDAAGRVLRQDGLDDPAHLTDPYYGDPASLGDPDAMHPYPTLDTARIAAQGDEVVLLLRNGHNAVVAYRLAQGEAGLRARWRTVVEPGAPIANVWLTGTHDPFGDLQHPWRVFMDVDAGGRVVVAAPVNYTGLRTAHGRHFAEPVPGGSGFGALVTVLDKDGARLPTTLLDTARESQLTAVRWTGAETVVLAGRIRHNPAASSGWDGYVTQVRPFQREAGPVRSIDIDRGDVILDAVPLADGRLLVAGASGYEQNTAGASISESAQPLLAVLNGDGTVQRRLPVQAGPRQNQVTSLAARGQHWLAAGLSNGPGTHSADANPAAILADGWVREFTVE